MATRRKRLSDSELRSLCEQEITAASAYSADLADERATAMDMYLGEDRGAQLHQVTSSARVITILPDRTSSTTASSSKSAVIASSFSLDP